MKQKIKIGNSVRVKSGIKDPDYNEYEISNWQGRIVHIDKENENLIEIEWDSITLKLLPKDFIIRSIEAGYEFTMMFLEKSDVELTQPRDSESEIEKVTNELNMEYGDISFKQQEENILKILNCKDLSVNMENLEKYFESLLNNIEYPCKLTGSEDFSWEEPYLFGGWSNKEYERLKKDNASYTDKFELIEFDNAIEDESGIFIKVKRISDKKIFTLPLWDLKTIDKNDKNHQLISDYSFWMTNYQ